jgi:hypothetical protein
MLRWVRFKEVVSLSGALKSVIIGELDSLDEAQLRQVLGSVRAAKTGAQGNGTVADLVKEFGGSIPEDELDRMERAIEEGL